jgi:hypothetical protein
MMFVVRFWSVSTIMYPIYEERSLLLAKEASIKIISLSELMLSGTNVKPLVGLSICYWIRLLSNLMLVGSRSIT